MLGIAAGMVGVASSQATDATPVADTLDGAYAVIRQYVTAVNADVDELISKVAGGYVPIISAVDGFLLYTIVYNTETRAWTAIAYFTSHDGADASTAAAADFVVSANLASYFEAPKPVVTDGGVIITAP